MKYRTTFYGALRAWPKFPRRSALVTVSTVLIGTLCALLGASFAPAVLAAGLAATAAVVTFWWLREVARPQGTRGQMVRSSEHTQRSGGVASWMDVQEIASPAALRQRRAVLRPSLAHTRKLGPTELGVCLAVLGTGRLPGQQVWSSCEDVTLRLGGPRVGKSLSIACHGQDAPGALLTTSTRSDLAEWVHSARKDRAVHVMNPTNYGGIASTVRWSILQGCKDFSTAQRRAADLVSEDHSVKDGAFWSGKARDVLALYLHAAALEGRRAGDVLRWATSEDEHMREMILDVITAAGPGGPSRAWQLRQHFADAPGVRKSVVATLSPALSWLANDDARSLGDADPETVTLDIERFIMERETLHLIAGTKSVSGVSNLIACIVSEVTYQARQLSGDSSITGNTMGRLDPPLTVLLDEAALICPVPLPRWTADMGGRNITLHVSIQSIAQMRERWGRDGAGTILSNTGALVVFGGGQDVDELSDLSRLSGEMRVRVIGDDHKRDSKKDGERRGEWRWVPVLTAAQISALKVGQVFVRRRGLPTVVGWAPLIKDRKGVSPELLQHDPAVTPLDGITIPVETKEEVAE